MPEYGGEHNGATRTDAKQSYRQMLYTRNGLKWEMQRCRDIE